MQAQLRVLLLLPFLVAGGLASAPPASTQKTDSPDTKRAKAFSAAARRRKETLRQIQTLVDSVFRFHKLRPKIDALTAFGGFLWEIDQPYAQSLFIKSLDLVESEKGNTSSIDRERLTDPELRRLRALIITRLSQLDPALALKLREQGPNVLDERDRFRSAITALDQNNRAEQAIKLAEQGWDGNLTGSALTVVAFVQKLRRTDAAAADQFYLRLLDGLANQPSADANDVLIVGTYIYTSPLLAAASDPLVRNRDGLALHMDVGNALVVDITANRPNVPPQIVRAYLSTAVNLLTRPDRRVEDPALDAAALRLLQIKAQNSMPEVLAAISARLHQLGVAPSSDVDAGRFAKNTQPDIDAQISSAENLSGERRDQELFSIAFTLYQTDDFTRARSVAEKISDLPVRERVLQALSFAEAAKKLDTSDGAKAETVADALPVGAARASLRIALAAHYAKEKNGPRALEAVSAAANDCRRIERDSRKAYLLLALATVIADVDPTASVAALKEAVSAFNAAEKLHAEWFDSIQIGAVAREFPLSVKLLDRDLQSCIERLTNVQRDATMALLLTLTDESLQGQSLVAFSKSIWKREVLNQ